LRSAPYADGPGLPREPPSASMMTARRLTDRTPRCAPGCGCTPRTAGPRRSAPWR
jgi:hypothetical protein